MKSKQGAALTTRDFEILQFVFEHRAVSHQQIACSFFNGAHRSTAHDRLSKISKAGYLVKSSILHLGAQTIFYAITNKGVQCFSNLYKYEITSPAFKSDSVNHDLGLVEIRKRLEKTNMVVEYLSESVLQSCIGLAESEKFRAFSILNSDAALAIDTKKHQYQVALEYEISDKQESRYAKKLTDYYFAPSVAAVFYICGNARIENLIRKVDAEVGQKFEAKVFACQENIFHRESESLPLHNRKNAIFHLK